MSDPAQAHEREELEEADEVLDLDVDVDVDAEEDAPEAIESREAARSRSRALLRRVGARSGNGRQPGPTIGSQATSEHGHDLTTHSDVASASPAKAVDPGSSAPDVVVTSPSSLQFAETALGQESEPQTVIITNRGASPVDIEDVAELGASASSAFPTYGGGMGGALAPGESVDIQVGFRPAIAGSQSSYFQVLTTGRVPAAWFAVEGKGVSLERSEMPLLKPTPRSVKLPKTMVGEESEGRPLRLKNVGRQPVFVESVDVEPGPKGRSEEFSPHGQSEASIEPGQSTRLQVVFRPQRAGKRKAKLVFRANQGATAAAVRVAGFAERSRVKSEEELAKEDGDKRLKAVAQGKASGPTETYREMLASLFAAKQLTEAGDDASYQQALTMVAPVDERMDALAQKVDKALRDYGSAHLAGMQAFGRAHVSVYEWKQKLNLSSTINADYLLGAFQVGEEPIKLATGELTEAPNLRALDQGGTRTAIVAGVLPVVAATLPLAAQALPLLVAEGALLWESAAWIGTRVAVWAMANPEAAIVLSEILVGLGLQIGEDWEGFAQQFNSFEGVLLFLAQLFTDVGQLDQGLNGPGRRAGAGDAVDAGGGGTGPRRTPDADADGQGGTAAKRDTAGGSDVGASGTPRVQDPAGTVSPETANAVARAASRAREIIDAVSALVRGTGKNPTASRRTSKQHTERAEEVRSTVGAALKEQGVDAAAYRAEVLDDKKFDKRFGSARGNAVTVVEDGVPVVYARPDAPDSEIRHEATHIAQLRDNSNPQVQQDIRTLSGETLGRWKKADAGLRKELYERKLRVEIDAAERELAAATGESRAQLETRVKDLQDLQAQVVALTDEQITQINAGIAERPEYLDDPSYLFGKGPRGAVDGVKQSPFKKKEDFGEKLVSSAGAKDGTKAFQLGHEWTEAVVVTTLYEGTVTLDRQKKAGAVVVQIDHESSRHSYVVDKDAVLQVKAGDKVLPGDPIAHEKTRKHRLVEIRGDNGVVIDTRTEELTKKGWAQSGEHNRIRGDIAEDAARKQIDAELESERQKPPDVAVDSPAAEGSKAALTGHSRIGNQSGGGGGFDDVVVEFRGTGAGVDATIRVVETKDYPNRNVPLKDMTAIRQNLEQNLQRLQKQVAAARNGDGPTFGMSMDQLDAVDQALQKGSVQIELRLGPTTGVSPGALDQLRMEVEGRFGAGSFGGSARIDQENIDAATRDKFEGSGDAK